MNVSYYNSPLGNLLIASDDIGLTGIWFKGQKYFAKGLENPTEKENDIIKDTKHWLDIYFSENIPQFTPQLHLQGTPFQLKVWNILTQIPYGETITYKEISKRLSKNMSAQAVGGAVGNNKISIIVPCHRVIGTNGKLTGYAGGIDKKIKLLKLEGIYDKINL